MVAPVGARGFVEGRLRHRTSVLVPKRAKAKVSLQLAQMLPPGFRAAGILIEHAGLEAELLGDERHQLDGRRLRRTQRPAGEAQIRQVDGEPEAVRGSPALTDEGQVFGGQGVVPNDRGRVGWRIEQRRSRERREQGVLLQGGHFCCATGRLRNDPMPHEHSIACVVRNSVAKLK